MFWSRSKKLSVHLVGIGGSGMSGIAEVLLASGFEVQGSDLSPTPVTERLKSLGAKVFLSHSADHLGQPNVVVVSSAVASTNPEVLAARRLGIPVIPRAEMLAELMRLKKGIAVAGSHGKTTTTSMLGQILRSLDPTVVVGGRLQHWNASSIVGKGSTFVIEADESDRSFLKFSPVYSIVTNIDYEHLDNYKDIDDIKNAFLEFLNRTAFFGENWISADCPHLAALRPRMTKPTRTFGWSAGADLQIIEPSFEGRRSQFQLLSLASQKRLGPFELTVTGKHNISNAAGAIGVALSLGLGESAIAKRLKEFIPADRRLQVHLDSEKLAIVEDYGHHPTEVRAALEGLRLMFPARRVCVLFQPHRYSRTQALWKDFLTCFEGVDYLEMLPIYAAHEAPIDGVSSERMLESIPVRSMYRSQLPSVSDFLNVCSSQFQNEPLAVLILGAAPLTSFAIALRAEAESQFDSLRANR